MKNLLKTLKEKKKSEILEEGVELAKDWWSNRTLLNRIVFGGSTREKTLKTSYMIGLAAGVAGRISEKPEIIALYPVAAALVGSESLGLNKISPWVAYGAGILTAHADKVYQILERF